MFRVVYYVAKKKNCIITSNKTKANKLQIKRERERQENIETKRISCMSMGESEILDLQEEEKDGII